MLGVSGDSLETHYAFSAEHGIRFPLISDTDGTIRKLYGGGRVTYLIDRAGVVRCIQKGVPDIQRFLAELARINRRRV